MRRVLVTGVTGFAGSHLVDYMLTRDDVEIFGIQRWRSRTENIEHFQADITLLECDLRDAFVSRAQVVPSSSKDNLKSAELRSACKASASVGTNSPAQKDSFKAN